MLSKLVWLARTIGFAVVGLLMLITPPHGPLAVPVTITAFCLLALALVAWGLLDLWPSADRYRARGLPLVLGLMAVVTGFASSAGGGSDSMLGFAVVAVLASGNVASLLSSASIAVAGVLAVEVGGVVYGQGFGTLLGFPLLMVVALLMGLTWRAYRVQAEQSATLLAQYERLQEEQRRSDVLVERTRIAREIHDVLAHSLGALGIQIQAAKAVLVDQGDIDRAVDVLTTAQRMAADGLVETRRAVHALRVDTLPLDQELDRAVGTHGQRYGVDAGFVAGGVPRPLPPDATVALLRTAQEALINAAKHAGGQRIAVRLDYRPDEIQLTVVNDLADDRTERPAGPDGVNGGYGLTGMHERLLLIHGTLAAGPQDNRWTVTARVPLAARSAPRTQPTAVIRPDDEAS